PGVLRIGETRSALRRGADADAGGGPGGVVQRPARAFQPAADGGAHHGDRVGEFPGPLQPRLRSRGGRLHGRWGLPRSRRGTARPGRWRLSAGRKSEGVREIGRESMTDCPVLIIGAGPTGLVLALWLSRLGVRVRIIDKTAEPGTTSRAVAVQAR